MTRKVVIGGQGLNLTVGSLSDPPTALVGADNVVVDAPGIIKTRRGFGRNTSQTNTIVAANGMFYSPQLGSNLFVSGSPCKTAAINTSGDGVNSGTTLTSAVNSTARHSFAMADENLYFLSDESAPGVLIRHQYAGSTTEQPAGIPAPLVIDQDTLTALSAPTGAWMVDNDAVTYRIVAKYTDDSGVIRLSAPSDRIIVRKQSGTQGFAAATTQAPTINWVMPPLFNVATGTSTLTVRFQVYRSRKITLTATNTEPGDELQMVYENEFSTSAYLGVNIYSYTDTTPDEALGAFDAPFLYTNPDNGEPSAFGPGIINSNDVPPWSQTAAVWRDCIWLGNITDAPYLDLQLLTVTGLVAGNTLSITDVGGFIFPSPATVVAVAGAPAAANQWKIVTGGTVSQNIERTAKNICAAINLSVAASGAYSYSIQARYISGYYGAPGFIRIYGVGDSWMPTGLSQGFSVYASSTTFASKFNPNPGTVAAYAYAAESKNTVAFSKQGIHEAFPQIQRITVGRADTTVQRVFAYRASLFIFTDTGIYRVTGNTPYDFQVEPFHDTAVLLNANCVAVCDDAIYAWCRQGILRMTENSADWIHLPIEPLHVKILQDLGLSSSTSATALGKGFVLAHQAQHKVYFFYPSDNTYSYGCDKAIIFDTRMTSFTTLSFNSEVGTYFRVSAGCECTANGKLYLGEYAVGTGNFYIRSSRQTNTDADFADTGADNQETEYAATTTWVAMADDPSITKQWREVQVYWNNDPIFPQLDKPSVESQLTFVNDFATSNEILPLNDTSNLSRQLITQGLQRSTRMQVTITNTVQEYAGIEGVALVYEETSDRVAKGSVSF